MPDRSTDVTRAEDASSLLLLWLAIHGGDPQLHDSANPFTVSAETYNAATKLVTQLSAEFGETKLTDRSEIAERMQARFGIRPIQVIPDRPICFRLGNYEVCIMAGLTAAPGGPPGPGPDPG